MLKELIRNTKPEIIVSIQDDYLDSCGGDTPARFVNLVWQWSDTNGNWASMAVLGAIDAAPDVICNFSTDRLTYDERHELCELMEERACNFNPLHDGYIAE